MVDALDLLQCPVCGTFYKPEVTLSGRTVPHCAMPPYAPYLNLSPGQLVEYGAVAKPLLTDVVDPQLTGSLLDMEV